MVLDVVGPNNVMDYQLDATLNGLLADLLGMGLAVVAFTALPPPASASTRHWRARRRMAMGLRAVASRPAFLLPHTGGWLERMFDRLSQLPAERGAGESGSALLLVGLLLLALRREDEPLGCQVGRIVLTQGAQAGTALEQLAGRAACASLQRGRIQAIASLLAGCAQGEWPGILGGRAA